MNCKQGDMAIVIRSKSGNEGAIVECVTLFPAYVCASWPAHIAWGVRVSRPLHRPDWSQKDYKWCQARGFDEMLRDEDLRPIRDNDGTDQTIEWAGKPEGVTV